MLRLSSQHPTGKLTISAHKTIMENNFYLTLMSNSSLNYYSENKTSGFTVHLPQKIRLTGEWVVALAEMHCPYNFFNVTAGENVIYIEYNPEVTSNTITDRIKHRKLKISPGFYKSINHILKAVNKQLSDSTSGDLLSIDELDGRTVVETNNCREKNFKSVTLSSRLSMQLGFSPGDNILNFERSNNVGNIYFGVPDQMLIYTDVIEPVFVGHEKAQVIKIVNIGGKSSTWSFGDVHTTEFQRMHYVPVLKKEFESISVDIRDCTGSYMPFRHGVSTVKLHFKKI